MVFRKKFNSLKQIIMSWNGWGDYAPSFWTDTEALLDSAAESAKQLQDYGSQVLSSVGSLVYVPGEEDTKQHDAQVVLVVQARIRLIS